MEPRLLIPPRLSPQAFAHGIADGAVRRIGGATMGTTWSLAYVARDDCDAALAPAIAAALDQVVAEMSQWEPASTLSRFNAAPAGSWHVLPPALFHVLAAGCAWAEASGGAFDPTLGSLSELWGFGAAPSGEALPGTDAITAARSASSWRALDLDHAARRACQPGGLRLDLSGIAKGFAVDRIAALVREAGHPHALVEIGGELAGAGVLPDGQPWWVELESPPGANLAPLRIALHGCAIATSGDYRRWRDTAEGSLSHSLDPRTGRPVLHGLAAVSVVAEDAMTADALATLLTVLGPGEGLAFAEARGIAARFVRREAGGFGEQLSGAMRAMLD